MFRSINLKTLIQWTQGTPSSQLDTSLPVIHISTDSRSLRKGDIFLALRGDNFDGHDFISEAIAKGATAVIAEKIPESAPSIRVASSLDALISIGRGQRDLFSGKAIGITGSAGKSSTKEMTASLLGPNTVGSPASFNNLIGLSRTLSLIDDNTRQLVLEMGMNAPGEISELCKNFRPSIGIITNIGDAHIGKLGSAEGIYRAKKELFDYFAGIDCEGIALNFDDTNVVRAYAESRCRPRQLVRYTTSDSAQADVRVVRAHMDTKTAFLNVSLQVFETILTSQLPIFGMHHVQNYAAAVSAARIFGVPTSEIEERSKSLRPASHRGEIISLGKRTLIDESYNSNPTALLSSLRSLMQTDPARRLVLILGEMRELGEFSTEKHQGVGRELGSLLQKRSSPSVVIGVGAGMKHMLAELKGPELFEVDSAEEAAGILDKISRDGDVIFVKGSRGVKLDKVILRLVPTKNA